MWPWPTSWSLEALTRLYNWAQASVVIFGLLTAAAVAVIWWTSGRITALQDEREGALRSQVVTLEQQLKRQARRYLTDAQGTELVYWLAKQAKMKIRVAVVPENDEARRYAEDLAAVFRKAGWPIEGVFETEPSNATRVGLLIAIRDVDAAPEEAKQLVLALKGAGITMTHASKSALEPDEVELLVGHKP